MALFSDLDWVILLGAAAFLFLGRDNGQLLRTVGRWYARAGKLKQELLAEFTKAAEIPMPVNGALSIRGALLGLDPTPTQSSGIPAAVTTAPGPAPRAVEPAWIPWTGSYPMPTWSMTLPAVVDEREVRR
ncbi:MAG TPA: hypothetical protein VMF04_02295 [Thermoplasmata archaeon]|nr:hypothetical protein [Thermoplasmata archaeon]